MAASIPEYTLFVGIDIAAKSFTALIHTTTLVSTERPFTLDQTPHGFTALQQRLAATTHAPGQSLIVLEATSTYWTALALTLHQAGYAVSVVNPEQVHPQSAALLQTIPGIAVLTTAWLLVATINFTISATPAGLAAYAGLVPLPRDSGSSIRGRPRIGHGGHGRLRAALYLATLSAARHNPTIKTFYDRLRAVGKPMKVARCAAARKLLRIAWAVVTKRQAFTNS